MMEPGIDDIMYSNISGIVWYRSSHFFHWGY